MEYSVFLVVTKGSLLTIMFDLFLFNFHFNA